MTPHSPVSFHRLPSHRASERGSILLLVAILALVLIGLVGLAVDTAHVNSTTQQLQAAADASSLAAARLLKSEVTGSTNNPFTQTRNAAVAIALANKASTAAVQVTANTGNAGNGDCIVGVWDSTNRTFTPNLASPNAVKVTARRTAASSGGALDMIFGGAFGAATSDVARSAIACSIGKLNPYVLVLDPSASGALSITGNGSLNAAPGDIQVNSTSGTSINVGGSGTLTASTISTAGGSKHKSGSIVGTVQTQAPVIADPLAGLLPDSASWTSFKNSMSMPLGATGKISGGGTYNPGYYPKGLSAVSSSAIVLQPGSYMFGTGVSLGASATITGTGVTIFLDLGANLSMIGGSGITLKAPTSGTYQGLAIFSHRGNTSSSAVSMGGNGTIDVEGTVYVPAGTVTLGGTSAQQIGELICGKLSCGGNGTITGKNVVPPAGAAGVCLVQ